MQKLSCRSWGCSSRCGPELRQADYLGLGPRETASDRAAGGRMGRWSYDVRQDFADFTPLYPQECGTRTQVYTARLTGQRAGHPL